MIFSKLTFRPGALVVGEPPLASGNSSAPVSGGAAASAALWVLGCGRFVRVYTGDEESLERRRVGIQEWRLVIMGTVVRQKGQGSKLRVDGFGHVADRPEALSQNMTCNEYCSTVRP